jgi:hypothetical protein
MIFIGIKTILKFVTILLDIFYIIITIVYTIHLFLFFVIIIINLSFLLLHLFY